MPFRYFTQARSGPAFFLSMLLLFLHSVTVAQITLPDSLEQLIASATHDTVRLRMLNDISKQHWGNDPALSMACSNRALALFSSLQKTYDVGTGTDEETRIVRMLEQEHSRALVSLGVVTMNKGNYPTAMEYLVAALKIREWLGDKKGIASVHNNMGLIYWNQADYTSALNHQLKALEMREELGDKQGIAYSYNNLGLIYKEVGDYKKALEYHLKGYRLNQAIHDQNGIANDMNNIGTVYVKLNLPDSALFYFRRSLVLTRELSLTRGMATALSNMGTIFTTQKRYDSAMFCFDSTLKVVSRLDDKLATAQVYAKIGKLYFDKGDLDKAILNNKRSLELSKAIGSREDMKDAYKNLAELYNRKKDFQGAYEYYYKYTEVKDSIMGTSGSSRIAQLQMQYESEKKRREQELLDKIKEQEVQSRLDRDHLIITVSIAGFVLMCVFVFFIFRSLQENRKAKRIIELQQKETRDSIMYAKRIQQSQLPTPKYIQRSLDKLNKK